MQKTTGAQNSGYIVLLTELLLKPWCRLVKLLLLTKTLKADDKLAKQLMKTDYRRLSLEVSVVTFVLYSYFLNLSPFLLKELSSDHT
jgi:hypothetical protein